MLYSIYRKASPLQLIIPVVLMLALWFPAFTSPPLQTCNSRLSLICGGLDGFNAIANGIPARIAAMIVLLISGFIFTLSLSANHMIGRQTYFPALILPLFASYSPLVQGFHMAIPAVALLVVALHLLMLAYEKADMTREVFSGGMFISLAAFFFFPVILFVFLPFIALLTYRNLDWRQWAAAFAGILTPFIYFFAITYFIHGAVYIRSLLNEADPVLNITLPRMHWSLVIFWGVQAMLLLRALASIIWHAQERVISFRKRQLVVLWFLIISQASLFLTGPGLMQHSIIIFIPISFYFTYYFFDRTFKRKWQADLQIYMLLLSLALTLFFGINEPA